MSCFFSSGKNHIYDEDVGGVVAPLVLVVVVGDVPLSLMGEASEGVVFCNSAITSGFAFCKTEGGISVVSSPSRISSNFSREYCVGEDEEDMEVGIGTLEAMDKPSTKDAAKFGVEPVKARRVSLKNGIDK